MLAVPIVVLLNAIAALVMGKSLARKVVALTLSAAGFVACWALPPDIILVRAWLWLGTILLSMRMIDVVDEAHEPFPDRLFLALGILDPREMKAAPVRWPVALVVRSVVWLGVGLTALGVAHTLPTGPLRWVLGSVTFYCGVEAVGGFSTSLYASVGLDAKLLQKQPYRSVTLAEFWGRRWNREVGRWLHRWCFKPLTRRGHPLLGVSAAFFWSGVVHAVPTYFAIGWKPALYMQGFFMVHGALVVAERVIGVPKWPAWAGHAWVVGVFVVTAPMFVEPGVEIMRFVTG